MAIAERPASYGEVFSTAGFGVLFAAQTLMAATETMKMLALSVLVYADTGSPFIAALAYMAGMIPSLIGGMFLLSLATKISPKHLLALFHLIRFLSFGVLATAPLPVPVVLACAMVTGLFGPVAQAASGTLLPQLLTGEAYVLGRSLFSTTVAASQVLGQAAGGVLLIALSPREVLGVAAFCSLFAAIAVWAGLKPHPSGPRATGTVAETWRGNAMLLADPRVRGLLLAQWLPFSLAAGADGIVVPYAVGLGRSAAGTILAAMATGMMLGTLLMGRFVTARRRERLTLPLALLSGAGLLFFGFEPGMPAAALVGLVGSAGLAYEVGLQHRFLQAVPENLRGQAFGLAGTGLTTGQAAVALTAGALTELIAPGTAIALCGAAALAAALVLYKQLIPG
jgi:predicted MFS family arabinose efflux permease